MNKNEEDLILNNINYAEKIAWKYQKKVGNLLEYDDLKSLCYLGLTKAAKTYNYELNVLFTTYAYTVMKNEIMMCLKNNKPIDSISIYKKINDDLEIKDILQADSNEFEIVDEKLSKNVLSNEMNKQIEKLKPKYKQIIKYKLKGKTLKEIGNRLNMKKYQITYHYQRALNILRKKMNAKQEGAKE